MSTVWMRVVGTRVDVIAPHHVTTMADVSHSLPDCFPPGKRGGNLQPPGADTPHGQFICPDHNVANVILA
jgi:hypothetical protein